MREIDKIARSAYEEVRILVKGNISNSQLATRVTASDPYEEKDKRYQEETALAESLPWRYVFLPSVIFILSATYQALMYSRISIKSSFSLSMSAALLFMAISQYTGFHMGNKLVVSLLPDKKRKDACNRVLRAQTTLVSAKHAVDNPLYATLFYPYVNQAYEEHRKIPYFMHEAIMRALIGLKNNIYDCVSASALIIWKLLNQDTACQIERFKIHGRNTSTPHSFVVINRNTKTSPHSISTYNDDCIFIDAWYGICISVADIRNKPYFFEEYFLLQLEKVEVETICKKEDFAEVQSAYSPYLNEFNDILSATSMFAMERVVCEEPSYLSPAEDESDHCSALLLKNP